MVCGGWEQYFPDGWVPHCIVALTGGDGNDACFRAAGLVMCGFEKLSGEFAAIGLVRITFPVEEVFTAALSR